MRDRVPASLARWIRERAENICEYCRLPQWSQEATFHIDHIQPRADGDSTSAENLALACVTCSLQKGARIQAKDPKLNKMTSLFHPRSQTWESHFRWAKNWRVIGRTSAGRATVSALKMNRPAIVLIRRIWAEAGQFPPDTPESR